MKTSTFLIPSLGLLAALIFLNRCGTQTTDLTTAAPAVFISSGVSSNSSRADREDTGAPSEMKPPSELKSEAVNDFKQTADAAASGAADFDQVKGYRAPCYGPSWTDTATGSSESRPGGDMGIIYATRTDTALQACAAAQLESVIGERAYVIKKVRALIATLIIKLGKEGKTLPTTTGSSISPTMPTVTGVTFTKAELSFAGTATDGKAVYQMQIEGTKGGKSFTIKALHSPKSDDNSTFEGRMEIVLPYTPTGSSTVYYKGLAMFYSQSATTLTVLLEGAGNRTTSSTDFFDATTHRLNVSSTAVGEDLFRMMSTVNLSTFAQTMHYAWQAGSNDGAVRAFAVSTTGRSSGATGKAYFGFGAAFSSLSASPGGAAIWPTKMFCRWAAGNGTAGTSQNVIQKQTMTFTSGIFQPDVGGSLINYAPTDSCSNAIAWTITGGPSFKTGAQSAVTHNLTTYTASDISSVSAPSLTFTM